jgi:hypothetical protein
LTIAAVMAVFVLPGSASAATCSDYATQAEAQRAADTRDGDGDGIYCESLPCPCLKPGGSSPPPPPAPPPPPRPPARPAAPPPPAVTPQGSCSRPATVQRLRFSATKYPNIKAHVEEAIAKGWPRVMVLNRPGADQRRDRLLQNILPSLGLTATSTPRRSAADARTAICVASCAGSTRSAGSPT